MWRNHLYFGDNLSILRESLPAESVDLIYLDPPFNSNATYNVLFAEQTGEHSAAQITAFEDTWHWGQESEQTYWDVVQGGPAKVAKLLAALREALGNNDMMAYLTMMTARLVELHRVLTPTGSLYLHCDPTASHYLKIMLDGIFGKTCYRTEISWKRSSAHNDAKQGRVQYGNIRDVIFFYTKSADAWTWHWQFSPYDQSYIDAFYRHVEPETGRRYRLGDVTAAKPGGDTSYEFYGTRPYKGRYWAYSKEKMEQLNVEGRLYFPANGGTPSYKRYLDDMPGVPLQNDWNDIKPATGSERLGYPTQKPEALLARIIQTSSNPGDVVLDPFCGCGTAIAVAERLGRCWIGIDITHLAITLMKHRLRDTFGQDLSPYDVYGDPKDVASAEALAQHDRYQFEWWALGLVDARPAQDKKKGADTGIDGTIHFRDDTRGKPQTAIVQVKSGKVGVKDIRDLRGVIEREHAAMGIFLTLQQPTGPMVQEALAAGVYTPTYFPGQRFPKLQILTVADLFAGAQVQLPRMAPPVTFRRAPRQRRGADPQHTLL